MLLDILLHQVIDMIVLHDFRVMVNATIIAPGNKKDATFWVAPVENSMPHYFVLLILQKDRPYANLENATLR